MNPPIELSISGMDCADCARTIERGVARLDGVQGCQVNFTAAKLVVQGDAPRDAIVERIRKLGYDVVKPTARAVTSRPSRGVTGFIRFLWARPSTRLTLIGALCLLPAFVLEELLPIIGIAVTEMMWVDALATAALLIAGFPILRNAWNSLRLNHEITINTLMVVAAIGAVVIGALHEAATVVVLFSIGEALEGYTAEQARQSIRGLLTLVPQTAIVIRRCETSHELEEHIVPINEVRIGERVIVKPGARIAIDGVILSGSTSVNQAEITGESMPAFKQVGDAVFAGSVNLDGAIAVEATSLAADNTIAQIVKLVESADENKAKAHRFIDRFARVYTPIVMVLALIVAFVPPVFFGQPFWNVGDEQGWLYRALELLVIACPCALVISTPVALISAVSNAAKHGVLIKGGAYIEALSQVDTIAFDKTGTLTEGKPRVVSIKAANCLGDPQCDECKELLAVASAVESRSEHPIAHAVTEAAHISGVDKRYAQADGVSAIPGKGVRGNVEGNEVLIGSHAYFDESVPHDATICQDAQRVAEDGSTLMMLRVGERYAGYIAVADSIRPDSKVALDRLHEHGVHTVMLTGDNSRAASAIAKQVHVDEVIAEVLPADKAATVRDLQAKARNPKSKMVAMVGDGVNDAPALAQADVGIAMGSGTAHANSASNVTLMTNDLNRLPYALKLARATMRNIYSNVAFSIGIKLVVFALALAGVGTLWMAVLADTGAALLVTLNGMRMARYEAK
jgi:Cd2+/Zn2+-exporting ATPase